MIKESFRKYLEEAIGSENALVAFSAFDKPASVSVRLNPFKKGAEFEGRRVPWSPYGLLLDQRPIFTLDPLFHAGAYYVQDSSSMFVGHVFRQVLKSMQKPVGRPLRVLDLCAAPGGKTTDLTSSLREYAGDDFILVANEVMKARVGVLADNAALWGDPNVVVTSDDPSAFGSLSSFFDIILADVPCSGEGMFRKDESAQDQWSEENVNLCAQRQRRIVADVWPALAEGGFFIYSTCTFNRYENDGNVGWMKSELGAESSSEDFGIGCDGVIKTSEGYSLVPGHVEGEGQYCACLKKSTHSEYCSSRQPKVSASVKRLKSDEMFSGLLQIPFVYYMRGDSVIAIPESLDQDVGLLRSFLHVVHAGCNIGMLKGSVFVPGADLALCTSLNREAYASEDVDRDTALAFLHRDTIVLPSAPRGYVLVTYMDQPLGFVKNLGNRCNNLHPQSRRIRMNIQL